MYNVELDGTRTQVTHAEAREMLMYYVNYDWTDGEREALAAEFRTGGPADYDWMQSFCNDNKLGDEITANSTDDDIGEVFERLWGEFYDEYLVSAEPGEMYKQLVMYREACREARDALADYLKREAAYA